MFSNINIKGSAHKVGGDIADGQWVQKETTVIASTPNPGGTTSSVSVTINDYLPEDGVQYEVLWWSWNLTGSSSGNQLYWRFQPSGLGSSNVAFAQTGAYLITRTASNATSGTSGKIPLTQTNGAITLNVRINANSVGANFGLQFIGYRKVGTNV